VNSDELLAFVRYHAWANDRILTVAAGLSDEALRATGKFDHDSAFQTFRHLVDVDWSWREFCIGNKVGESCYLTECGHSPGDLDLLEALTLKWPSESHLESNRVNPPR
jgi:hypothetical protein